MKYLEHMGFKPIKLSDGSVEFIKEDGGLIFRIHSCKHGRKNEAVISVSLLHKKGSKIGSKRFYDCKKFRFYEEVRDFVKEYK